MLGVDGRPAGELGRDLDHGLVDEDGDGVEVAGVAFETEALGFEGDGAAAGEGGRGRRAVFPG